MARINNQAVLQKLIDELKLYPATDSVPTELAEKILPVFQINSEDVSVNIEENLIKYEDTAVDDNDKTLTTPAGKKWSLKNLYFKYVATATVGNRQIFIIIKDADGETIFDCSASVTLAAASQTRLGIGVDSGFIDLANCIVLNGGNGTGYYYIPKDIRLLEGGTIRVYDAAGVDAVDDLILSVLVDEQDI